jgi:pimeloyl-ACP methyl ester carboxylesterase
MSVESPSMHFHRVHMQSGTRRIAYKQMGDLASKNTVICLPGLLETQDSFEALWSHVTDFEECCWISLDYCGRGQSDPLPQSLNYSTSVYLSDIEDLVSTLLNLSLGDTAKKLHFIGTSMGGILAMYLVQRQNLKVQSLVLNDIGASLHWSSLMALYQQIKNADSTIARLQIDPRVVSAVHNTSHFDLAYEYDLFGMQFHKLLADYEGKIILLHNSHSRICPLTVAEQSKKQLPQMELWTQYGLEHPAKWDAAMATKLSRALKLKKRNYQQIQTPEKAPVHTPQPEPAASTPQEPAIGLIDFMEKSRKYLESTAPASLSWINKLLGKLNRLKNYRLLR